MVYAKFHKSTSIFDFFIIAQEKRQNNPKEVTKRAIIHELADLLILCSIFAQFAFEFGGGHTVALLKCPIKGADAGKTGLTDDFTNGEIAFFQKSCSFRRSKRIDVVRETYIQISVKCMGDISCL